MPFTYDWHIGQVCVVDEAGRIPCTMCTPILPVILVLCSSMVGSIKRISATNPMHWLKRTRLWGLSWSAAISRSTEVCWRAMELYKVCLQMRAAADTEERETVGATLFISAAAAVPPLRNKGCSTDQIYRQLRNSCRCTGRTVWLWNFLLCSSNINPPHGLMQAILTSLRSRKKTGKEASKLGIMTSTTLYHSSWRFMTNEFSSLTTHPLRLRLW